MLETGCLQAAGLHAHQFPLLYNNSLDLLMHCTLRYHGLTNLRNNRFTDMLYSSMVPGILPGQLEILWSGQSYFDTAGRML